MATQALEAMVTTLESTGNYRILRRLDVMRACSAPVDGEPTRIGCIVDVETTGLDAARDEIIQLAILPIRYAIGDNPRVVETLPEFNRYRQPSRSIGRAVTELTGIDDATVAGHRIDPAEVDAFMARYDVDFVVAHNARFDRDFLVRAFPDAFAIRRWLCSLSQVPWDAEAFRGRGLGFLGMQAGWFCRSHDAAEDCRTLAALLNHPLPVTGKTPLAYLLAQAPSDTKAARMPVVPTVRIRAVNAPFESKDTLKARGYRWCAGTNVEPKAWYIDVADERRTTEVAYLKAEILGARGKAVVEAIGA